MLILKKKIIFITITQPIFSIITKLKLFYHFIKNKLIILISLSTCILKKHNLVTKNLTYFYSLKYNSTVSFILNTKLNSLIEFLYNVKNISCIKNLNYLLQSKYYISVIRSPFVYKKSMEQFFFKKYRIYYQTSISIYNFFFQKYQYIYIKKILHKKKISKLFCKIIYIFN